MNSNNIVENIAAAIKRFPSNPDLQGLKLYEKKGVECVRDFINQLLKDPSNLPELVGADTFKNASLIFTSGSCGIPQRVLMALENQTADQLTSNNYTGWGVEIDGAHTNTVRINLRNHSDREEYFWCAVTPADGIFALEYYTKAMENKKIVNNLHRFTLTRSSTFYTREE